MGRICFSAQPVDTKYLAHICYLQQRAQALRGDYQYVEDEKGAAIDFAVVVVVG